jgi:SAM-dependent methyltransferase
MYIATYAVEAEIEQTHWWFVGRRRLFAAILKTLPLASDAAVLDIGSSTGANLRLLRELGISRATGLDSSVAAIGFCKAKGLGTVDFGDACALPYADERFDLVLATDVVEHVDHDNAAFDQIRRVLKPGGYALITVPAFPSLWGIQDVVAHHKRRYRMMPLRERIASSGLSVEQSFHFNFLLFAPIWIARQVIRLWHPRLASEGQVNTPLLNRILGVIFRLDTWIAPRLHPAFGVSILALAQKPKPIADSAAD